MPESEVLRRLVSSGIIHHNFDQAMKTKNIMAICASVIFFIAGLDSASAQIWFPTTAPSNNWTSVTASADGSRLVAVSGNGFIYTSSNYGSTWVSNTAPTTNWAAVAGSADGTKLVATGNDEVFTNAGTTWTVAFSQPSEEFAFVTSSADGIKLVTASSVVDAHGVPPLFVSTNSGVTWTNAYSSSYSQPWVALTSSADGNKLAAAVQSEFTPSTNGTIYTSTNGGATWMENNVPYQVVYTSLSCSADGSELLAANSGGLLISTNAGSSWMVLTNAPSISEIACSTNGRILFGLGNNQIYSSANAGASWITNDAPLTNWAAIAVSANGTRAVAVVSGGGIYVLQPPPQVVLTNAGKKVILFWPTNYTGFGLQQSTNLATTNWIAVTNVPAVTNSFYQITLPTTNRQLFFRLKSP